MKTTQQNMSNPDSDKRLYLYKHITDEEFDILYRDNPEVYNLKFKCPVGRYHEMKKYLYANSELEDVIVAGGPQKYFGMAFGHLVFHNKEEAAITKLTFADIFV